MEQNKTKYNPIEENQQINSLGLLGWEIDLIRDGYKQILISKERGDFNTYSFRRGDETVMFEIVEISPCKYSMLSDIDAYYIGLANLSELHTYIKGKFGESKSNTLFFIQRIKLV